MRSQWAPQDSSLELSRGHFRLLEFEFLSHLGVTLGLREHSFLRYLEVFETSWGDPGLFELSVLKHFGLTLDSSSLHFRVILGVP